MLQEPSQEQNVIMHRLRKNFSKYCLCNEKVRKVHIKKKVLIENDNKPLVTILGKPLFKASRRLQRMMFRCKSMIIS